MSDDAARMRPGRRSVGAFGGQQIGLFERPAAPRQAPLRIARHTPSADLRFTVLGSGSRGNSLLFEADGRTLMVDCGFSCRELEQRCRARGVELREIDAIVLTHEHQDHCRGAARISRRHGVPIFATAGTARGRALRRVPLEPLHRDATQEIAGFEIEAFSVPHDAREPVGLVVGSRGGCRVGVLADAGSFERSAARRLDGVHGLVVETNHDTGMLRTGPYPWSLKQRVGGRRGHLSNDEAACALEQIVRDELECVVAYHLSEVNNMPALARRALAETLDRLGSPARIELTEQDSPTPWLSARLAPTHPSTADEAREAHVSI